MTQDKRVTGIERRVIRPRIFYRDQWGSKAGTCHYIDQDGEHDITEEEYEEMTKGMRQVILTWGDSETDDVIL